MLDRGIGLASTIEKMLRVWTTLVSLKSACTEFIRNRFSKNASCKSSYKAITWRGVGLTDIHSNEICNVCTTGALAAHCKAAVTSQRRGD